MQSFAAVSDMKKWAIPFDIGTPHNMVLSILPPQKSKLFTAQERKVKVPTVPPSDVIKD